jgi:hypothetical protein
MAITFTTMSIPRPQKLYPNWYFWYETTYTVWQLCCGAVDGYGIAILPGFEHVATIVRCDTAWPLRWRVFGQVFSFNLEWNIREFTGDVAEPYRQESVSLRTTA